MRNPRVERNWPVIKDLIKSKWRKFDDAEVESVRGDLGLLVGKVQYVYGMARVHADAQVSDFRKSVQTLIG